MAWIAPVFYTVLTREQHEYAVALAERQARTHNSPRNVAERQRDRDAAEALRNAPKLFGDLPAMPDNTTPLTAIPKGWVVEHGTAKVAYGAMRSKSGSGGGAQTTGAVATANGRDRGLLNYAARGYR